MLLFIDSFCDLRRRAFTPCKNSSLTSEVARIPPPRIQSPQSLLEGVQSRFKTLPCIPAKHVPLNQVPVLTPNNQVPFMPYFTPPLSCVVYMRSAALLGPTLQASGGKQHS